jgi:hypothetical protein
VIFCDFLFYFIFLGIFQHVTLWTSWPPTDRDSHGKRLQFRGSRDEDLVETVQYLWHVDPNAKTALIVGQYSHYLILLPVAPWWLDSTLFFFLQVHATVQFQTQLCRFFNFQSWIGRNLQRNISKKGPATKVVSKSPQEK